jgi:hypothetical protein
LENVYVMVVVGERGTERERDIYIYRKGALRRRRETQIRVWVEFSDWQCEQ